MPKTPHMIRRFVHKLLPEIRIHLIRDTPQTIDQLVEEIFQVGFYLRQAQNPPRRQFPAIPAPGPAQPPVAAPPQWRYCRRTRETKDGPEVKPQSSELQNVYS